MIGVKNTKHIKETPSGYQIQWTNCTKTTKITKTTKRGYNVEVNRMASKERPCNKRDDTELDKGRML